MRKKGKSEHLNAENTFLKYILCTMWPGIFYRTIIQRVNLRIFTKREIRAEKVMLSPLRCGKPWKIPRLDIIHVHLSFPGIFLSRRD